MSDMTRILAQLEQSDPQVADKLLPFVHDELRKLAAAKPAPLSLASRGAEKVGITARVRSAAKPPATVKLEREGNVFRALGSKDSLGIEKIGAVTLTLPNSVYGGLVVCSHDDAVAETAAISNTSLIVQSTNALRKS
jgi:hypothetical protein